MYEIDRDSMEDMETEQDCTAGLSRFASKPRPDETYLPFNNSQINSKALLEDGESQPQPGLGGDTSNRLNESVTSNFGLLNDEDDHIKGLFRKIISVREE